jgi:hypothetical protein
VAERGGKRSEGAYQRWQEGRRENSDKRKFHAAKCVQSEARRVFSCRKMSIYEATAERAPFLEFVCHVIRRGVGFTTIASMVRTKPQASTTVLSRQQATKRIDHNIDDVSETARRSPRATTGRETDSNP